MRPSIQSKAGLTNTYPKNNLNRDYADRFIADLAQRTRPRFSDQLMVTVDKVSKFGAIFGIVASLSYLTYLFLDQVMP